MAYELNPGCPSGLAPATEPSLTVDPAAFVQHETRDRDTIELMVRGAKCANCIRKIEGGVLALPGVENARLNLSTGRLAIAWKPGAIAPRTFVETLAHLG